MCEFCTQHGEGKKWYLEMRNYSRELYAQDRREEFMNRFFLQFEETYSQMVNRLDSLKKNPRAFAIARKMADANARTNHFGQVVPLEDIERIIDIAHSIVRLPCVCRRLTTGREVRYCLGLDIDPYKQLSQYPDFGQFDALPKEEAKQFLRSLDEKGMTHSVWTFKTPYIGGICNCDRDCLAHRLQVQADLMKCMFRAEYVAIVDWDACSGCRECIPQCQFDAMSFSLAEGKTAIDPNRCYGCGVCRPACSMDAIHLKPREECANLPW